MQPDPVLWPGPMAHLTRHHPDVPVMYFSPAQLQATARRFRDGFDGLVTYAVKANDRAEVLAGITSFDVASPAEMAAVRAVCPEAVLHYNNPVRSPDEIQAALRHGIASASVDCADELTKLAALPRGTEIAVRFKLPVAGAAYDFGAKFGAEPEAAAALLRRVVEMGFVPSLCFHPGTQCDDPTAWVSYLHAAAQICAAAAVQIGRLNVGGGFASHRDQSPDLEAIFTAIRTARDAAFPDAPPQLICEPGRAMVAEAFTLVARVKSTRQNGAVVYLNDGIYGGLAEWKDIGPSPRIRVMAPCGRDRSGPATPRAVFGPTCDSIDRLPDGVALPQDTAPGDYVLFAGMGAYSLALSARFNGYGVDQVVAVAALTGQ